MTSISELFPKCRKLAYDARQQLAIIQQSTKPQQTSISSSSSSRSAVSELYLVLEELNRQLDMMEQLLLRETPAQRQVWKQKITSTRQEAADLQQQAQAAEYYYASKQQQLQQRNPYSSHQRDREEVLRHRRRGVGAEDDMQHLAQESQSLQQSQSAVMNLISQGQDSLDGLYRQRQQLRGVQRVIVGIDDALGLSQSTMRIIERRDITDAYFVAAGMVVTLIVIYVVWFVF